MKTNGQAVPNQHVSISCSNLVSAEERPRLAKANLTHRVLQVGVNLDLKENQNHVVSPPNSDSKQKRKGEPAHLAPAALKFRFIYSGLRGFELV